MVAWLWSRLTDQIFEHVSPIFPFQGGETWLIFTNEWNKINLFKFILSDTQSRVGIFNYFDKKKKTVRRVLFLTSPFNKSLKISAYDVHVFTVSRSLDILWEKWNLEAPIDFYLLPFTMHSLVRE